MSMSVLACVAALVQFQSCGAGQASPLADASYVNNDKEQVVISPAGAVTGDFWQGLYGGVSVAYGVGTSIQSYDRNNNHGLATVSPKGFTGSVTAGYNYRVMRNIVVGIEGDLGYMALKSGEHTVYDGHVWNAKFGPMWGTIRGRVGYSFNRWLLFGTAGLAFMQTDNKSIGNTAPETAIDANFRTGWVAGLGAEYAFSGAMSAKVEFLHLNFGKYSSKSANNEDFYFKDKINMLRVGLNYHF